MFAIAFLLSEERLPNAAGCRAADLSPQIDKESRENRVASV